LITNHRVSRDAFIALAHGGGDPVAIGQLLGAEHSKHLMLLHAVAEAADAADPSAPAAAAFQAGFSLIAQVQAADPDAVAWQLGLPHIGGWVHDCLSALDQGSQPDFGYLAGAAAAAAIRAGLRFELDVPARDGGVLLPGLGRLHATGPLPWVRLSGDGARVTVGDEIEMSYQALAPDDGSGEPLPHWQGTPLIRAVADGHTWNVLLENRDRHLDRYAQRMSTALTVEQVENWRHIIQSAWQVLVRHHGWAAASLAEGVSVIVPLTPESDLDSATTPTAFGAIATSLPPDPVMMAETLVHEFQHLKLCGLMDMLPLIEPCEERVYAPWRPDPRPAGGLLQGIYAFLGIACFWDAQRQVESDPSSILRAQVMYERWRTAIEIASGTLLNTGALTATGVLFVNMIRERTESLRSEPVPDHAREIAEEMALDHWLTWQLRHTAVNTCEVADLAASYQRGEPLRDRALPEVWIEEDRRKVDSTVRTRLLGMRHLECDRYRQVCAASLSQLSTADALLIGDSPSAAVQAYRDEITATDTQPEVWIGLALAVHRCLYPSPLLQVFATKLPLMFDMYTCLSEQGVRSDPLDLAAWFA
jgi:HEXXH motif-containing protein